MSTNGTYINVFGNLLKARIEDPLYPPTTKACATNEGKMTPSMIASFTIAAVCVVTLVGVVVATA